MGSHWDYRKQDGLIRALCWRSNNADSQEYISLKILGKKLKLKF